MSGPDFDVDRRTILRTEVGSTAHGTAVAGSSDVDELGICVEPPDHVLGLRSFNQRVARTAAEGERSGVDDLDATTYGLRRWTQLAVEGNPSIVVPLFVADADVVVITDAGRTLRATRRSLLAWRSGYRFLGYLESQRAKLVGERGNRVTRPELVAAHGFDTKFAYHAARLGFQGVELLTTGELTLPLPQPIRTWLVQLRAGRHTLAEAVEVIDAYRVELRRLLDAYESGVDAPLPRRVDRVAVDAWLVELYLDEWHRWGDVA